MQSTANAEEFFLKLKIQSFRHSVSYFEHKAEDEVRLRFAHGHLASDRDEIYAWQSVVYVHNPTDCDTLNIKIAFSLLPPAPPMPEAGEELAL